MFTMLHRQITKNRNCTTHHCFPSRLKKPFIYITSIIILILITITIFDSSLTNFSTYVESPDSPPQIYRAEYLKHKREAGLPIEVQEIPVLELKTPVRGEDNIIFLYTTCVALDASLMSYVTTELRLTYQQVCAIESAAIMNPKSKVYLFYTCPLNENSFRVSSELIRRLFNYPNINVWHQNMSSLFQSTPLEDFYKSNQIQQSRYRLSHASDVLRYFLLWKYGGIYLDLDFIITKPLQDLGKNFACQEEEFYIASGAMGMSADGIGAEIADKCIEELRTNFRGDIWNHNGPGVITRIMQKKCGVEQVSLMTKEKCGGFRIHRKPVFYAVDAFHWRYFYSEMMTSPYKVSIADSHAVHLWNSMAMLQNDRRTSKRMRPGSKQPISWLQQQFCPEVYNHVIIADAIEELRRT